MVLSGLLSVPSFQEARSVLYGGLERKVHPSYVIVYCVFNLSVVVRCRVEEGSQQLSRGVSAWF
jgi:hypothetical protein